MGLTIDWWLKKQITEDVFSAAMGYELPEDLKTEIRNFYGNKILCKRHVQTVDLDDRKNGLVAVTVSIERTLENISEVTQPITLSLGIDDWGQSIPSTIIEFGYEKGAEGKHFFDVNRAQRYKDGSLSITTDDKLKPNETIKVFQKYCEIKRDNDQHLITFTYATQNPTINVQAPSHLAWIAGFVRRPEQQETQHYTRAVSLDGILLPHQMIRVRWWRAAS